MTTNNVHPFPAIKPSVDHLMDAPLDELLAEFDIELTIVAIDEPMLTGVAVIKDGKVKYFLPAGRPEAEREIVVRAMLGQTLHVPLPDLPDPYQVSEFDENGDPQLVNPRPRPQLSQADEALRCVRGGAA